MNLAASLIGTASRIDWITHTHTSFTSFDELLNALGGYRPSFYVRGKPRLAQLEILELVIEYDKAQEARNDSRRAFRGDFGGSEIQELFSTMDVAKPVLEALRVLPAGDGVKRDGYGIPIRGGSVYRSAIEHQFTGEQIAAAWEFLDSSRGVYRPLVDVLAELMTAAVMEQP